MAKFSKKMGGKEVGEAKVYAQPHNMKGVAGVDLKNAGYEGGNRMKVSDLRASVGSINTQPYPEVKKTGIKIRGTGAATKGVMARGPMA